MKTALIGASGFVGAAILRELVSRHITVLALARHPEKITAAQQVKTAGADVNNVQNLAELLTGYDTVISAFNGGWTNPNLYADFIKGAVDIEEAAKKAGVKRLIVVGGAGSLYIDGQQLVDAPGFPEAFKPGATAARDYLNILKEEKDIQWTFVSPAIEMNRHNSGTRTGTYRTGKDNPVFDDNGKSKISVEDLAVAIVDELEHPAHINQRFTVGY